MVLKYTSFQNERKYFRQLWPVERAEDGARSGRWTHWELMRGPQAPGTPTPHAGVHLCACPRRGPGGGMASEMSHAFMNVHYIKPF